MPVALACDAGDHADHACQSRQLTGEAGDVWSSYQATWQPVQELPVSTTPEDFAAEWAQDGQPTVVRGGAVGWPALQLWTLASLRERFGDDVSNREPDAGEVMFDADGVPIDVFNDQNIEDQGALSWEYVLPRPSCFFPLPPPHTHTSILNVRFRS